MSGELNGKVALVTGAGSGIGKAVTERYLLEGARVVAMDFRGERLAALSKELGGEVLAVAGDVRRRSDTMRAVALARDEFGRLDTLVANAGVFDGFASLQALPEEMTSAFRDVFEVNVLGYILSSKAAAGALREHGGSIIMTASVASFHPGAGGVLYTASKHAVVGLVKQLAQELAPHVRVNGVAPGGTLTSVSVVASLGSLPGIAAEPFSDADTATERLKASTPLGLAATGSDHAGAYVFLASDQARIITGTIINSDGGLGVKSVRR